MLLQKLKAIRADLDAVIAGLDTESPVQIFQRKPLPTVVRPAYDACRQLWEAAQKAHREGVEGAPAFNIFAYIPGLQPSGGHMTQSRPAEQMNADIIALGFTEWGQKWLSDDRNAALIDPVYLRHFLGYAVVRKNQNDESQGYNRIP